MSPEMWWSITSNSLEYSICTASYAQGVTGFWTEKFAMSKVNWFKTYLLVAFDDLTKKSMHFFTAHCTGIFSLKNDLKCYLLSIIFG